MPIVNAGKKKGVSECIMPECLKFTFRRTLGLILFFNSKRRNNQPVSVYLFIVICIIAIFMHFSDFEQ